MLKRVLSIKLTSIIVILLLVNITRGSDTSGTIHELVNEVIDAKSIINFGDVNSFSRSKYSLLSNVSPEELIKYYNYDSEKYAVHTSDGYEITLYRIIGNLSNSLVKGKATVLLQHGLFGNCMNWLIAGPDRSLAFSLVDLGFDVWLANSRGSMYSRNHTTKSPNESEYWNYSWHEMGIYDLPAEIDHILETTGEERIIYVGHGQGATTSYVLLSERPEYNDKIMALFSLAPIAYFKHIDPFIKLLARFTLQKHQLNESGYYEVKGFDQDLLKFVGTFCSRDAKIHDHCDHVLSLLKGYSEEEYDPDVHPEYDEYRSNGLSLKQMLHYDQIMVSGRFQQFDYGRDLNKQIYHRAKPLDYKIENIKVPTMLVSAKEDLLSPLEDLFHLYKKLPVKNGIYGVNHDTFNHNDFLWGLNVRKLVNENLISHMLDIVNKYDN